MNINRRNELKGSFFCIAASLIWGLSFVAQKVGIDKIDAFSFNGIRMLLGSAVLLPFVFRNYRKTKAACSKEEMKARIRHFLIASVTCGIPLFIGSNLQQQAFKYIEVGKVGFITAFYMVLVPIFGLLIFKTKARINAWLGVLIGIVGLYLLCISRGAEASFGRGETLTLLCSFAFAFHILAVDRFSKTVDSVSLSFAQFLFTGVISSVCMFAFETPSMPDIISVAPSLLYAGIMSSGVAFTFQILGQKRTEPAVASLLLSLESVFSVLFGWLLLKQALGARELIGCAIMFAAIVLAQLPNKRRSEQVV